MRQSPTWPSRPPSGAKLYGPPCKRSLAAGRSARQAAPQTLLPCLPTNLAHILYHTGYYFFSRYRFRWAERSGRVRCWTFPNVPPVTVPSGRSHERDEIFQWTGGLSALVGWVVRGQCCPGCAPPRGGAWECLVVRAVHETRSGTPPPSLGLPADHHRLHWKRAQAILWLPCQPECQRQCHHPIYQS